MVNQDWWVLIAIIFIVIVAFKESLFHGFTFDDHLAIENNGDVTQPFDNMTHIWTDDIWGKDLRAVDSHKSYRPLLIELFRFLWHLLPSPALFRCISLILHVIASYYVYLVISWISLDRTVAIWTSLLFAAHPVHVEAVVAVVNLAEPLYSILTLASFLFYRASIHPSATFFGKVMGWLGYVVFVVAALGAKETAAVAPLFVLAHSISHAVIRWIGRGYTAWRWTAWEALFCITSAVLLVLYFLVRASLTDPSSPSLLDNPLSIFSLLARPTSMASSHYLDRSDLLRRAENPYSFLSGSSRVWSLLVSVAFHIIAFPLVRSNNGNIISTYMHVTSG